MHKVRTRKLNIERYKNERGFEQIAKRLGIPYPEKRRTTGSRKQVTQRTSRKTKPKKRAPLTATDQVLRIINRYKRGVDVLTLMQKTGFEEKKVRNIVARAFKQGRIKRLSRGMYVGA